MVSTRGMTSRHMTTSLNMGRVLDIPDHYSHYRRIAIIILAATHHHSPPFSALARWTSGFKQRPLDGGMLPMSTWASTVLRSIGHWAFSRGMESIGVHLGARHYLTQIMPGEHKKYCFKLFYMTSFQHWPLWHLRDITGLESSNSIILRPKSQYEYESPTQIVKWGDDLGCAEIPAPTPKQHQRGWECEKSETFTVLVMRNISFYTFTP